MQVRGRWGEMLIDDCTICYIAPVNKDSEVVITQRLVKRPVINTTTIYINPLTGKHRYHRSITTGDSLDRLSTEARKRRPQNYLLACCQDQHSQDSVQSPGSAHPSGAISHHHQGRLLAGTKRWDFYSFSFPADNSPVTNKYLSFLPQHSQQKSSGAWFLTPGWATVEDDVGWDSVLTAPKSPSLFQFKSQGPSLTPVQAQYIWPHL